ncbi:MAG: signal peptidase I [bacterium]|nr:signal peptidase I [bacterium]
MQIENEQQPVVDEEQAVQPDAEEAAAETEEDQKKKKAEHIKKEIISWILTLGVAVVAALVIRTFLFEPIRVDGQSMCDTLQDGEIMLVTKPEYLIGDPEFGDVIICKYPGRGNTKFVKRVLGVPGDEIMIVSNIVIRNGEVISEPYLTPSRNDDGFSMMPYKLGEDEYFVAGDNRDNSHDSRNYYSYVKPSGITRDMIVGKVRCVFFPFDSIRGIE